MAQILVPGTAEAVLKGTVEGHPFNCRFHYQLNSTGINWSLAQLQSLCDGLMSGIAQTNGVAQFTSVGVVFQQVQAVDLGTSTPNEAISTHAAISGIEAGVVTPSTCVLVDNITQARYRGGHSRTYMPPMGGGQLSGNADSWSSTAVGNYNTAFGNMHDAAFNAVPGMHQVCIRYVYTYVDQPQKHKYYAVREAWKENDMVLNWLVKANIGTQRRRARIGG